MFFLHIEANSHEESTFAPHAVIHLLLYASAAPWPCSCLQKIAQHIRWVHAATCQVDMSFLLRFSWETWYNVRLGASSNIKSLHTRLLELYMMVGYQQEMTTKILIWLWTIWSIKAPAAIDFFVGTIRYTLCFSLKFLHSPCGCSKIERHNLWAYP